MADLYVAHDRLVVFDVEYTAWEGSLQRNWSGEGEHPEIIQLGAVKLSRTAGFAEIDCLDVYVQPRFNPDLSDYITRLTGITNELIANQGVPFEIALLRFVAFCEEEAEIYSFGHDEYMLVRNCEFNRVDNPIRLERFGDLEVPFTKALDLTPKTMSSDLVDILHIDVPGRRHTALTDARILAEALRILVHQGDLQISSQRALCT